jgi:hypothetical protein
MVRTFKDPAARTAPVASRRIASPSAPLVAVLAGLLAWSVSPVLADAVPFGSPELIPVTDDVEALVPADINGDGRPDLVVAESRSISTGELLWLENTIAGWVRHSIALSDLLGDVAVGDIDGDGTLDIVASSPEVSAVRWFANDNGDGSTWTSRAVAGSVAGVEGIEVADLDRDGRLDVVGALSGVDEVRFWRQTPAGLWQERLVGTGATGIRDIALGDIDVDGRIDVVGLVPGAGQIRGWINPDDLNTATSWSQRFIGVADDPVGLEVADFDHDGAPDVLAASRSVGILGFWRNDGAGTGGNWQRNTLATVDQPAELQVLDLDRDGDLDVAVSGGQAGGDVMWLDNQGDGGYTLRSLASGIQGAALAALDLEPDGDPDLVLGDVEAWQLENRSPAVGARFGFADQVFAPLLAGSSIQSAVRIGRINDDARPDILVTGVTPPEVSGATALLNFAGPLYGLSILPPFVFSQWPGNMLPPRLTAPAIGDFDRDGRNELLFGSNDNGADLTTMGVCANSAPRYEEFPTWDCRELFAEDSAAPDFDASISGGVFSADIDRDGWPDLVAPTRDWLPVGTGVRRLQWFEHLGDFSSTTPFRAHEIATGTFSVVGLADLNRDGRTDIVTSERLFRNSADDGSIWNEQAPLPFGWTFVDIGDVDLDGGPDLLALTGFGSGLHWARRDGPDWPTFEIDPDAGCPCRFADIDADGDLDVVAVDGDGAPVLLRNTFSPGGGVGWSRQPVFPQWSLPVDAIYALDFSDDGLPELIVRSESTEYFFTNQASTLNAEWTAVPPAILVEGDAELVFELDLVHAGRAGDPDIAVTELRFQLSNSSGDGAPALTNAELDAVVARLAVYRDDGDGLFDAGDELIAESSGGPFSDETIVLDAGNVRPATTVGCCDVPQRLFVEFTAASGAEAVVDPVFLRPAVIEAVDVIEQGAVRVQAPPALRAAELDLAAPVPGEEWLSVRVFGDGSVESSPIGIQCDADGGDGCSDRFASGSTVSLLPVPPTGQLFAGWEGDCSGLGNCDLVMDATKSATARFEPEGEGTVNVTIIGGGGRVTSDPPRIQCPDACTANFNVGSEVTLTATPDPGFEFGAWVTAAFCPDTQSPTCTFTVGPVQTITLSFLPAADPERTLTVAVNGQGRVTSSPAGIDCGATCVADFPTNERVLLTAIPEPGWRFDNWGDACSGPDPNCLVELAQDTTVLPRFVPEPVLHRVTVSVVGGGQVQSTPSGIDCPSTCSVEFEEGTSLLLEQQAAPGFVFAGWTSSVSCGTVACAFTVDGPVEVEALFVSSAPQVTLDVTVVGSGRVTSQPAGIDCPGDCSASFDESTIVDLFAAPEPGFEFLGWSGACSGTGSCTVTLDTMRQVEASFASIQPRFDLDVVRIGNGFVGSTPGGIECGTSCTASFEQGTEVELVAAPSSGWRFSHWDGDCIGVGACTLTMEGPRQVEGVFVEQFPLRVELDGSGAVVSDPAGIDCGTVCTAGFDAGARVELTAAPDPGWVVAGWIGASCPVGPTCTLEVDAARTVTARFEPVADLVFRDGFE